MAESAEDTTGAGGNSNRVAHENNSSRVGRYYGATNVGKPVQCSGTPILAM